MRRVRGQATTHQPGTRTELQQGIALEDGTVTLAMIRALIPWG